MLYTIYTMESIFPYEFDQSPLVEYHIQGRICLGRRGPDGLARLERLVSTDASDYLDPRFMPQTVIDW
ncbi:MAG: YlzJ-like family protein [Sulfobacillus sp.]